MAKKKVTTPGGDELDIDAPDDASDEEVVEFAQQHLQAKQHEKQRKELLGMIDAQNKAIDILRDDVLNMAKLVLKHTDRIDKIYQRAIPAPVVKVDAPIVKVSPELRVIADPGIAAALHEMHQSHEESMNSMMEIISKLASPVVPESPAKEITAFRVEHETDRHSPQYGRVTRVIPINN